MARLDWEVAQIAYKQEAAEGTPEALTAAEAGVKAFNVAIEYEDVFEEDNSLSGDASPFEGTYSGPRAATLSFDTPVSGSGTLDVPPQWGGLLEAMRWKETINAAVDVTYDPDSDAPPSLTLGFYVDGVFYQVSGAVGDAVMNFTSGQRAIISWTFQGVYTKMTDVALLAGVAYPDGIAPAWIGGQLTFDGEAMMASTLALSLNNNVVQRPNSGGANGLLSYTVVGKRHFGVEFDPETVPLATKDWHAFMESNSTGILAWNLGTVSTNKIGFSAPAAQIMKLSPGNRDLLAITAMSVELIRDASGNDELQIIHE